MPDCSVSCAGRSWLLTCELFFVLIDIPCASSNNSFLLPQSSLFLTKILKLLPGTGHTQICAHQTQSPDKAN